VGKILGCLIWPCDGTGPVQKWLRALPKEIRIKIGADIRFVEDNWPVGPPKVKSLEEGIWEIRSSYDRVEYRVAFCIASGRMIILHGFVKKTQKTSPTDLRLIRERRKST